MVLHYNTVKVYLGGEGPKECPSDFPLQTVSGPRYVGLYMLDLGNVDGLAVVLIWDLRQKMVNVCGVFTGGVVHSLKSRVWFTGGWISPCGRYVALSTIEPGWCVTHVVKKSMKSRLLI